VVFARFVLPEFALLLEELAPELLVFALDDPAVVDLGGERQLQGILLAPEGEQDLLADLVLVSARLPL